MAISALSPVFGGSLVSINEQKKANKANEKAFAYQKQQNDMKAARDRRDAVRSARIAAAAATQAGANQGVSDSSASQGGVGSIISQGNDTVSFLDQWNTLSDMASIQLGEARKHQGKSQTAAAIADLGMKVFSAYG